MSDDAETPILPAHIDDTVRAIARLHAEHRSEATTLQRLVECLTAAAGRPRSLIVLTMVMVAWMTANLALPALGHKPWDEPPFAWLQGATGVAALYMTILILVTQRREDQIASHREQLTLELGILSEQKAAKLIELLEELQRDLPHVRDRVDVEAAAMSAPADPEAVLADIKETHDGMLAINAETSVRTGVNRPTCKMCQSIHLSSGVRHGFPIRYSLDARHHDRPFVGARRRGRCQSGSARAS